VANSSLLLPEDFPKKATEEITFQSSDSMGVSIEQAKPPPVKHGSSRFKKSNLEPDLISKQIEEEKLKQLKQAATKLQSKLKKAGRCEICTLKPPCKHYDEFKPSALTSNKDLETPIDTKPPEEEVPPLQESASPSKQALFNSTVTHKLGPENLEKSDS